jgi:hypothetical protein
VNTKRSWEAPPWLFLGSGLALILALGVAKPETAAAQSQCAGENGTCSFSGVNGVVYGANGAFNGRIATNSTACNNATFGDPISGVAKACYARSYTLCASENGTCSFSGVADVAYGANASFNTRTATNSIACNNATFGGDPISGVVKSCYYRLRTQCSGENGTCSFTGTGDIAYGANATFFGRTAVSSISCSNGAFGGDPLPNTVKACHVMVVSTSTSGGGGGGSDIGSIVSSAQFDQIWNPGTRSATYTYADFVTAAASYYPGLCQTGDSNTQKRECAAYFASKNQETGVGQYDRELYCQPGGGGHGGAACNYCGAAGACGSCASGQQYWGRHAVQLSWNYNYCAAGNGMGLGSGLHSDPNSIFNNKVTGWRASNWYWMTQLGPAVSNGYGTWPQESAHDAITTTDGSGNYGFGGTIRAVNGSIECQSRVQQQLNRVTYYNGSGGDEEDSSGGTLGILGYTGGAFGRRFCSP